MLSGKFWGPLLAARFLAPKIAAGGSLTFFSGLAAYRPGPGTAVVAAVNAGLEGLAKALAVELAPIRVNVLSPGVLETPGWDFMPEADRGAFFEGQSKVLPTRYVGTPADVAEAAATLMTNPYITGTVLHVDGGGRLAWRSRRRPAMGGGRGACPTLPQPKYRAGVESKVVRKAAMKLLDGFPTACSARCPARRDIRG